MSNKVKPQHELEWLANNVPTWRYDHKKFIYRNETLVSFHPIYTSAESNYLNGYTKQQWQECRYKLGLDDRPNEEVKMTEHKKPPLGLIARSIHARQRAIDILSAMSRYVDADKPIPRDWMIELSDLYGEELVN